MWNRYEGQGKGQVSGGGDTVGLSRGPGHSKSVKMCSVIWGICHGFSESKGSLSRVSGPGRRDQEAEVRGGSYFLGSEKGVWGGSKAERARWETNAAGVPQAQGRGFFSDADALRSREQMWLARRGLGLLAWRSLCQYWACTVWHGDCSEWWGRPKNTRAGGKEEQRKRTVIQSHPKWGRWHATEGLSFKDGLDWWPMCCFASECKWRDWRKKVQQCS